MPFPTPSHRHQSGALFGLDARIALTVFGAVAVVIGYVSFGRLEIARQAALTAELEAFDNALQTYQAHMGTFFLFTLNKEDASAAAEDLTALWSTDVIKPGFHNNWHGPYLHRDTRRHKTYGAYTVFYATADRQEQCTVESTCHVWLALSNVPEEVWKKVNSYYDEAHGRAPEDPSKAISSGRVQSDGEGRTRQLFFRTVGRPVQ